MNAALWVLVGLVVGAALGWSFRAVLTGLGSAGWLAEIFKEK